MRSAAGRRLHPVGPAVSPSLERRGRARSSEVGRGRARSAEVGRPSLKYSALRAYPSQSSRS
eukprot:1945927-Prymnesium_polylepis.1